MLVDDATVARVDATVEAAVFEVAAVVAAVAATLAPLFTQFDAYQVWISTLR